MRQAVRLAGRWRRSYSYKETFLYYGAPQAKLKVARLVYDRLILLNLLDERKFHLSQPVYLVASALFMVGSAALALSQSIEVMIGMRALQAAG